MVAFPSSGERMGYRLPNPWRWDPFGSIAWQAVLAAMLAAALLAVVHLVIPPAAGFMVQVLQTWAHETSHYGVAIVGGGQGSDIVIDADGSGHTKVSVASPYHAILVHAAGLILPAWLAAFMVYAGITRKANTGLLVALAVGVALVAYFHAEDEKVLLALSVWAGLAFVIGVSPASGLVKAVAVLFIAFTLTLGVLGSLDYAFVDYIDGNTNRPSDTQAIADALGTSDLQTVGNALVIFMIAGYVIAMFFAINWVVRHTRPNR